MERLRGPVDQVLVTCLFDLPRREGGRANTLDLYQRQGRWVLSLPLPVVLFIEPELTGWALDQRRRAGLLASTRIVAMRPEELPLAALLTRAASLPPCENADPVKDTPLYYMTMWSKFDMVAAAMARDDFGARHYAWIDIGIAKVAQPPLVFPASADRFTLLQMRAVAPDEVADRDAFYRYERGRLACGLMRANVDAWNAVRRQFQQELLAALDSGRRPHEMQVLSRLSGIEPERFDHYYGDYSSILCNWDQIRDGVTTVFGNLAHCREHQLWSRALDICDVLERSVATGALILSAVSRARLLDEHFIVSWSLRDLERCDRLVREFLTTCAESDYFATHRARILSNFALLEN